MARLNISIPDPLHERLERLRERMNLSEVCAVALEREAAMAEAQPRSEDPDIQGLVARLRRAEEVWRLRGYEDGRKWAVTDATRQELLEVAEPPAPFPGAVGKAVKVALGRRFLQEEWPDLAAEGKPAEGKPAEGKPAEGKPAEGKPVHLELGRRLRSDVWPESFDPGQAIERWVRQDAGRETAEGALRTGKRQVDRLAYRAGWQAAVRDVWAVVKPALG
jgi:hypothetical protein